MKDLDAKGDRTKVIYLHAHGVYQSIVGIYVSRVRSSNLVGSCPWYCKYIILRGGKPTGQCRNGNYRNPMVSHE